MRQHKQPRKASEFYSTGAITVRQRVLVELASGKVVALQPQSPQRRVFTWVLPSTFACLPSHDTALTTAVVAGVRRSILPAKGTIAVYPLKRKASFSLQKHVINSSFSAASPIPARMYPSNGRPRYYRGDAEGAVQSVDRFCRSCDGLSGMEHRCVRVAASSRPRASHN